jgi:cell division septum initiation protein DivIVA
MRCDDSGMSVDKRRWTAGPTVANEPSFDIAFRGYDRRAVDQYAHTMEAQLVALVAERQESQAQLRILGSQLHQVQAEVIELRRRPTSDDSISYRHLGLRVEQMLALAEEQAHELTSKAIAETTAQREDAAAMLRDAHELRERSVAEFESVRSERRAEMERELAGRREAAEAEIARMKAEVRALQAEAASALEQAHQEAQRMAQASELDRERIINEAVSNAKSVHAKAEEDAAEIAAAAEDYARQTRSSSEEHARQNRNAAEEHARATMAAAEQTATEVRRQAEQHAAQVRATSEMHAAKLHAVAEQIRQAADIDAQLLPDLTDPEPSRKDRKVKPTTEAERLVTQAQSTDTGNGGTPASD